MRKGTLIAYPKINYIEAEPLLDTISDCSDHIEDLSFYWHDSFAIEYLNNNYLGPSVEAVKEYYKGLALHDDCDEMLLQAK